MKKFTRITVILAGFAVALAGPITKAAANDSDEGVEPHKDCQIPSPSVCKMTADGTKYYAEFGS